MKMMMMMETLRMKSPQRPSPSSQPPTSSTASGAAAKHHYFKSFAPHFRVFVSSFSKHFIKVDGERGCKKKGLTLTGTLQLQ